jgi:dynein heavy chain
MLTSDRNGTGPFLRLLVVRMLREDRTLIAVNEFIRAMDVVDASGIKLAAMGPRYVEPVADTVDRLSQEINALSPVIFLLSAGADPTESVETLARKKKTEILCVSMGEGQERVASSAIATATINGSWVLLQNCHLGLAFMESMEELFVKIRESCSPQFRLFITTEPHSRFPIGLLQMSTKVTNEPPKGLRAGLLRSYSVMIDRDKLERLETVHWRKLLYTLCFLHSIVQERRKFGPLGWCVPYEYNDGDLNACTTFLEKHLYNGQLSWPTLQYMVGEVQYGGKITDDLDRRMFNTYTEAWLSLASLQPGLMLNPDKPVSKSTNDFKYVIPDFLELEEYHAYIKQFPDVDSPEIFGLHPNADLTFRYKEVSQLLNTILETQPKQSSADASGRTREDLVQEKCEELLSTMPEEYKEDQYLEQIAALGGLEVPLNIFLMQEVQRMQFVIDKVS